MNKKEAIAYAQITLDYMQSSKYSGNLNIESFGAEMRQCFRLYSRDVALSIANAKLETNKEMSIGSDTGE